MRFPFFVAIAFAFILPYVCSLQQCTEGSCCKDGNILPNGTVCRQALDDCDETEYCTGSSSFCPPDQFAKDFDTYCRYGSDMGVCEQGICMTTEVISHYEDCQGHCSTERGKCTLRGECVCDEGWKSPPECDKKTLQEHSEQDPKPNMHEQLEKQDERVLDRNRREVDTNVYGSRIDYIESEATDEEHKKMLSMQNPPRKGTFARLKEHPLFIPMVILLVGFIILVAFVISAKTIYQSEMKKQRIQRRIKVEKPSPEVPKNVSKIDDPTVNVDVGR